MPVTATERIQADCAVPPELAGGRLDQIAARLFTDYSRERLKRWIRSGELRVNGATAKADAKVRAGDQLTLRAELRQDEDWHTPQAVPFEVLYESPDVLVVDKPAGVVMHPGAGVPDGTLVNGLLARFPELAALPRAGVVHRLDKETSGLVLVGRTLEGHTRLVRDLAAREVERRYLLIVRGELAVARVVDAPIGRHPVLRTRMAVCAGARPARTDLRPLAVVGGSSLLEAKLHTGRTHQIRVHAAHAGFPLLGDPTYGVPRPELPRQALHAWRLRFRDAGDWVSLRSLPPADFLQAALAWGFRAEDWLDVD